MGRSWTLPKEPLRELFRRDGLLLAVGQTPQGHDPARELALPHDRRERRPGVIGHLELRLQWPILVRTLRRYASVAKRVHQPAGGRARVALTQRHHEAP